VILPGTGRGTGEAGGGGVRQLRRPEVVTARKLRREMSLPEVLLWQRLRGSATGMKFRRQHPVGPYVADFFCREASLAVEVDGQIHDASEWHDRERDRFFETNGLQVLHVAAADVLADPDAVAASIGALALRPLHQPAAGPPPRAGEDQE
jgi:very-short-patch-repair endonuclease